MRNWLLRFCLRHLLSAPTQTIRLNHRYLLTYSVDHVPLETVDVIWEIIDRHNLPVDMIPLMNLDNAFRIYEVR